VNPPDHHTQTTPSATPTTSTPPHAPAATTPSSEHENSGHPSSTETPHSDIKKTTTTFTMETTTYPAGYDPNTAANPHTPSATQPNAPHPSYSPSSGSPTDYSHSNPSSP